MVGKDLYVTYRMSNSDYHLQIYKSEKSKYQKYISEYNKIKSVWNIINSETNRKHCQPDDINLINEDDSSVTDDPRTIIANLFAKHFNWTTQSHNAAEVNFNAVSNSICLSSVDWKQFGFRPNLSTELAIFHALNSIYGKVNTEHEVGEMYVDLSRAFDTLDHALLIDKLWRYGDRGACSSLLHSYLHDLTQLVCISSGNKTYHTDTVKITQDVPQGSILGPLLFII